MSGHGTVRLPFGNGEYDFCIAKHKQLFELQDRCGLNAVGSEGEAIRIPSGPLEIFERLRGGRWREADVVEPIRLGLIGADNDKNEIPKLLKEFVIDQPLGPLAAVAARIVFACVYGVQGDEGGKKKRKRKPKDSVASTSGDQPSTEQARPSASAPETSTK